jgi:glycosyltransferase involved in cell wall biosynthesis
MPFFSVIIASRNRPDVLSEAVNSVLDQTFEDYEIIIVDDGSDEAVTLDQLQLNGQTSSPIKIIKLSQQPRGRGPGYARNIGAWESIGQYCAFLDDDDSWSKTGHLADVHAAIEGAEQTVDLYLSNQEAVDLDGIAKRLWLYPVVAILEESTRSLVNGVYSTTAGELIGAGGFCHLNTTIVKRSLFDSLGGLDEYLAYEEDLDFYLRAIDSARSIVFSPDIVARHNVPDRSMRRSASTVLSQLNKLNIRLFLLNKNMFRAQHESIAAFCRDDSVSTTKHIADQYVREKNYFLAYQFAMRALGARFSLKWFVYCVYLRLRAWRGSRARNE